MPYNYLRFFCIRQSYNVITRTQCKKRNINIGFVFAYKITFPIKFPNLIIQTFQVLLRIYIK